MATLRSPNSPAVSLEEALQRGRRVYDQEHTHPASRNVIAQDLGYKGISGPSAALIGALRQYGVLEGRGEEMHISDDAVAAFELPDDSPDRAAAISRMAFRPPLFEELQAQFGNNLPGEANLRHHLIKKGFLPDRADEVIRTYRANVEFVVSQLNEYNEDQEQAEMPIPSTGDPQTQAVLPKPAAVPANIRQDVFSLAEGPITIQWPASLSPESFQDLADWLDIVKRKIGRSVKEQRVDFFSPFILPNTDK